MSRLAEFIADYPAQNHQPQFGNPLNAIGVLKRREIEARIVYQRKPKAEEEK